jgi:uncharacterized protein YceK
MRNLERSLIVLLCILFALISGCESSSTDSDSTDSDSSATASSTATCDQNNLCTGVYTTNVISGEGLLNGPCWVGHIDVGKTTKIVFKTVSSCDFKSVQADGDAGLRWATLANTERKLLVHHKGLDVYMLRVFMD